jgi:hypothetical protein
MSSYVTFSGAGYQINGSMVPVASLVCADVLAGAQAFHDDVLGGSAGYVAVSCSTDPVAIGTNIEWRPAYTYSVSGLGSYHAASSEVAPAFDYALGSQFYIFGFVGVAMVYLFSHGVGLVLKMVRDH